MKPQQNYPHIITDDTFRETASHGSESFPFCYYLEDIWDFDFHCVDWHWHHELEVIYIKSGSATCYVGEEKFLLPQGSALFVNSGILHRYESTESTLMPNIVFSPSLLAGESSLLYEKYIAPILSSSLCFQTFSSDIPWQGKILDLLNKLFSIQDSEEKRELHTVQTLWEIWEILFDSLSVSPQKAPVHPVKNNQVRLRIMMEYIHEHYSRPISLDEIASCALISKSSALQIFQTGIQLSPVAYLIQYRLNCAAKLLRATEDSVSEIAEKTGFSSAGYFCRKFRHRYQMSPIEYRKISYAALPPR